MTTSNQPLSEQYRIAATDWAEKDGAARLLEETKTAVLSQHMKALGDIPAAHAERDVKASDVWADFIERMVRTRTAANMAKVKMEYLRMKAWEQNSQEATARVEARL